MWGVVFEHYKIRSPLKRADEMFAEGSYVGNIVVLLIVAYLMRSACNICLQLRSMGRRIFVAK